MCRDRASKDTENAIQLAHEDNHSAKAGEVLLSDAKAKGARFCAELSLVPSLQEVKELLSKLAKEARAVVAGGRVPRKPRKINDVPSEGDSTFFLGKGKIVDVGDKDCEDVFNAVGFFLFTQCAGNARGEWPATVGTARRHCMKPTVLLVHVA
jgi:hypothetical protein